jgi:hypothetical protein
VAEAARAEMHADPDPALLVLHHVDVVVAGADRTELVGGRLRELALRLELRVLDLVQHRVIDALARGHTHSERNPARDLAHDPLDASERVEIGARELGARCLVAAP